MATKPQIAFLTEIPTPYRQGVLELLVRDPDFDVTVFFLAATQHDRPWQVVWTPSERMRVLSGWQWGQPGGHTFFINTRLQKELFFKPFDAFVIGGYAQWAMYQALKHCWKHKRPYVMVTESHFQKPRGRIKTALKERYLRQVYGKAQAHLVMGQAAQDYACHYGASADSMFRFPNTVDGPLYGGMVTQLQSSRASMRARFGLKDEPIILYVGALVERKGIRELLRAFEKLSKSHTHARLLLVGEGPQRALLDYLEPSLRSRVLLTGYIQPHDLPRYYAMADVFVLPALDEPFGAVVCEAAASGLPVLVSSAVGAAADFVRAGESGRILDPHDMTAWVNALSELISDEALRRRMGEAGKHLMQAWTHQRLAQEVRGSLERAVLGCTP